MHLFWLDGHVTNDLNTFRLSLLIGVGLQVVIYNTADIVVSETAG